MEYQSDTNGRQLPPWKEVGQPLCRALGLNPSEVTELTVKVVAGEMPEVTVKRVLPRAQGEAAAVVLERFRLELIDTMAGIDVAESASLSSENVTTHVADAVDRATRLVSVRD